MDKWTETELFRYREGQPNTADQPTRYLKTVVYHFSSGNPEVEGCAAHGSNTLKAAQAGLDRLKAFQQAVENTQCCGASIDLLLIGLDTDTDAIRVHLPDHETNINLTNFVDTKALYDETASMNAQQAEQAINDRIDSLTPTAVSGMQRLVSYLVKNNFSQIEYVRQFHNGEYADIGHAERFMGLKRYKCAT
jgi:carboxysome shell carbonic anhydrase